MKNRQRWGLALVLISLLACEAGCSQREAMFKSAEATAPEANKGGQDMASAPASASGGKGSASNAKQTDSPKLTLAKYQQSEPDRYLIKNSTLTLEAADVRGAARKLTELAKALQGYVSDSREAVDGVGNLGQHRDYRLRPRRQCRR